MGQTVVEKITQAHLAEEPRRPVRAGDFVVLRPRHVMTHDNTAPVMRKFHALGAQRIADPTQAVFVLDHDIQNRSPENVAKYRAIEEFAREQGVDFFPAGSGIGHQIVVEELYATPGTFVVASDSHANMYGALGAVGTPIVRTDAAAIWATGTFWWQVPRMIDVRLEGRLPAGSTGKDVIIALCAMYGTGEVLNAAVEFSGPGVASLSMDERLAIANMTTEWGALVGLFPVDDATVHYVRERHERLLRKGVVRVRHEDVERWAAAPLRPDTDAVYSARITLDLTRVGPHVSGPDTVHVATPLADLERRKIAVHKAYLVSCVNSRADDIAAAASVLAGRHVAEGVELYVAAASREVEEDSRERGTWQTLLEAGARPLPPGCGPCIGLGAGLLEPGEVGISATNRNFKGRMGSREAECYLASPAVVAASAAAGYICGPQPAPALRPTRRIELFDARGPARASHVILRGFPESIRGRLVFVPRDNLDTDGIFGKEWTYRDDVTPERMAAVVMENHDPRFASLTSKGDVLVSGFNFGTGSSREQAVTALQAKGIAAVVAGSYSATYLRNAFNNGFLCLESPALVHRLREIFASEEARTLIPGDELEVGLSSSSIVYRGEKFPFLPLGAAAQVLVIAGGVEAQVRRTLGLE